MMRDRIDPTPEQTKSAEPVKTIRVFIASPGDVAEERDLASLVVGELNRIFGNPFGVDLDAVRWVTHEWPDIGDDAQDVINKQIGEFDILVGIMWRRFGSPTKRAKSGTGEEFERAYNLFKKHGRPKVMFYFRTTPFYTTDLTELTQFRKVVGFQKAFEKLGLLYWTYDAPLQFERNVGSTSFAKSYMLARVQRRGGRKGRPLKANGGTTPGQIVQQFSSLTAILTRKPCDLCIARYRRLDSALGLMSRT